MKIKSKKLLVLTMFACLVMGGLLVKPIHSFIYPSVSFMHSVVIARDINLYIQSADAIVVGEVNEVSDPYFLQGTKMIQKDVIINVSEILKGDNDITDVSVVVQGGQIGRKKIIVEDGVQLREGEHVLLFLGTNSENEYVVFAGPYGKYLIDENNTVTSIGDFAMDLDDLKAEIKDSLENGEEILPATNSELIVQQ